MANIQSEKKLIDQQMTIVVQVNGKVRAELRFDTGMQKINRSSHFVMKNSPMDRRQGNQTCDICAGQTYQHRLLKVFVVQ